MHIPKRQAKQRAARIRWARWRAAEARAQAERDEGILDAPMPTDVREPLTVDLRCYGGALWQFQPRTGYCGGRLLKDGEVQAGMTLKQALIYISSKTPAMRSHA